MPGQFALPWSGAWAWPALAIVALYAIYLAALLSGRHVVWLPGLRRLRDLPLSAHLALAIALIAALPGLLLAIYLVESGAAGAELRARARLAAATDAAARSLERRVGAYQRGLAEFAGVLGHFGVRDVATLEKLLDAHIDKDGDYLAMLIAARDGRLVTARGNPARMGRRVLPPAPPVADRAYFVEPLRTGRPYLSDVFRGRGFGNDALVALSAPVTVAGRTEFVVQGAYALTTIERLRDVVPMDPDSQLLVLDRVDRVIHASDGWRRAQLANASDLRPLVTPDGRTLRSVDAETAEQYLVAGRVNDLGWKVLIRVPLTAIRDQVAEQNRGVGVALVAWIVLSALLGGLLVRRLAAPVMELAASFARFDPARPDGGLARPSPLAPQELRQLHVGAARTRRRLRAYYRELSEALLEEARLRGELDATLAERDAAIAERTRELAARSAALERANRLLETQARSDPLTGIPNQRAFMEHFELAWRSTQRMGYPLSVLMIDVDRFKQYNDSLGHPQGDICLRAVAVALQSVARRSLDFVARYGGEEFVLVLSATGGAGALQAAEDVRRAVRALGLAHPRGIDELVTVSVGVATVDAAHPYANAQALLAAADDALYRAKRAGRDRSEVASLGG